MGESTKAVSALVAIVGAIAATIAWTADHPDALTWGFRIGAPAVTLGALALILKLHSRQDLAHDFLRDRVGTYFNRDGFCFGFVATAIEGIAYLDAYFQNQHDKKCVGRIALRPARGFFMGRANIDTIGYEIDCAPAAFGVARIAVPIPENLQGKRQRFEVGASAVYPDGKGQRLRFYDGIFLRTNTNFGSSFRTAITVAGAAGGAIVLSKPAMATLEFPIGVADQIPGDHMTEIRTLWQLGDLPLDPNAK